MRRYVLAVGVALAGILGVVLVGRVRTHVDPKCLHVSGAHATAFRAVRVFDGKDMLGARDVLVVDGSVAAVGKPLLSDPLVEPHLTEHARALLSAGKGNCPYSHAPTQALPARTQATCLASSLTLHAR